MDGSVSGVFKGARFTFTQPICSCDEQKISWNVEKVGNGPGLVVWCTMCSTKLHVSNSEFKASIHFETAYPGKRELSPEEKDKLRERDFQELLDKKRKDAPS